MTVQAIYGGEIASDKNRGALGSFMNLFMAIGFLVMNSVGPYLSYTMVQVVLLAMPCLLIATFSLMPESPFYYVAKYRKGEAVKALEYLRNHPGEEALSREITAIEENIRSSKSEDGKSIFAEFLRRRSLKAVMISGVLIACQQLSGINGIFFYTTTIFQESGINLDANVATIILCCVQLVAGIITPFLAKRFGGKTLLLFSCGFAAAALLAFAAYRYGVEEDIPEISKHSWLPITALMVYLVSFSWGLAAVPWAVISEIFPSNVKGVAAPIMTCIAWTCTFLVTQFFQPLSLAIGSYWVFGIFAAFALFGLVFTVFVVFETRGLTLLEVQQRLDKKM